MKQPLKAWANEAYKSRGIVFLATPQQSRTHQHECMSWDFTNMELDFRWFFFIISFRTFMRYLRFRIAKCRGYFNELIISIWSFCKTDIVGYLRNLCGAVYCIGWCTTYRDGRVSVNFVTLCMSSRPQEYILSESCIQQYCICPLLAQASSFCADVFIYANRDLCEIYYGRCGIRSKLGRRNDFDCMIIIYVYLRLSQIQ